MDLGGLLQSFIHNHATNFTSYKQQCSLYSMLWLQLHLNSSLTDTCLKYTYVFYLPSLISHRGWFVAAKPNLSSLILYKLLCCYFKYHKYIQLLQQVKSI